MKSAKNKLNAVMKHLKVSLLYHISIEEVPYQSLLEKRALARITYLGKQASIMIHRRASEKDVAHEIGHLYWFLMNPFEKISYVDNYIKKGSEFSSNPAEDFARAFAEAYGYISKGKFPTIKKQQIIADRFLK